MERIFTIWPTIAEFAREIGEKPVTVSLWKQRGSIPGNRDVAIVEAAKKRGVTVTYEELARARHREMGATDTNCNTP